MSAMNIATKTLAKESNDMRPLFEALKEKYDSLPPVEEMLKEMSKDSEFTCHFIKPSKKKSSPPEERMGVYNEDKCDARVWKEKPKSGGLGYDNIQCSAKKIDGSCFCKRHGKTFDAGELWVGKITDPRPEPPIKPDGTVMIWSTDPDGNEVEKEKKERKPRKKKNKSKEGHRDPASLSMDELNNLLKDLAEKEKKEKEEEKEKKEKEEKEEKEKEEKEKEEEEKEEEGEEGGIGAGTGLEDEKDEDEEDEDEVETITVDGVEYQHDKDTHVLTRCADFEEVGKWNMETEEIDFNEEDEDEDEDEDE